MRRLIASFALAAFLSLFAFPTADALLQDPCSLGTSFRNCRACGTARGRRTQELNVLKNRSESADNVDVLTIPEIRKPSNNDRFSPDTPVEVAGFVASVVRGGNRESCNCGRADLRDLHINVVATPQERNNPKRYVIVEITPRWQQEMGFEGGDYEAILREAKSTFEGKWVLFQGWMLYDHIHANESQSTAPNNPANWRATPWEVHPVTYYEILPGPPQ